MDDRVSRGLSDKNILRNGRKNIGLLVGNMASIYQEQITFGASDAAKEKDFNVIVFSGGPINSPNSSAQLREKIFDMVDTNLIDGLIIPMSSHARYLDDEASYAFFSRFSSVPIVNVGGYLEGYTNIISDYESGIDRLMNHFINRHGYKRIAFFGGPKNHNSTRQRREIYIELLGKYGLSVDDNLIVYGDLQRDYAKNSVMELFDIRKETCDAIICVNDNQALGIIDELIDRGISVPDDIAVAGSTGATKGVFSTPSLTTINEPNYELGRSALFALANLLEGKEQPEKIFVPTELIIRESCGCSAKIIKNPYQIDLFLNKTKNSEMDLLDNLFNEIERYCSVLLSGNRVMSNSDKLNRLLNGFKKALVFDDYASFLCDMRTELEASLMTQDITNWIEILTVFQTGLLQYMKKSGEKERLIEFFEFMLALKNEYGQKVHNYQNFETDFYIDKLRMIVNNLNHTFDLNAVTTIAFDVLGVSECYISTYEKKNTVGATAINIMAVRDKEFVEINEGDRRIKTKALIPQSVKPYEDRYTLMVFPLSYRIEPLGYLMLNLNKRRGKAYENIQAIISLGLKNELQIRELKEAEERFSDIAHSTSDWLWETNAFNQFTYCSGGVEDVLGYTQDEILEKSLFDIVVNKNTVYDQYIDARKNMLAIESWNYHKNGKKVCLLLSATPIIKDGKFAGYRGVFKDITEAKIQEEKIRNLAYTDNLTGLPNRTMFHDKLELTIKSAERDNRKFALMFIDMDRFKYVNDSLGHAAGDALLKRVAILLNDTLPMDHTLARLGGDEFTVIMPDIRDKDDVIAIAKEMLKSLVSPIAINGNQIFVTISVGIAIYPTDAKDSEGLLKKADTAMYRAKDGGRNRFTFYDKEIERLNSSRILYEEILYNAIENNAFFVDYQPQFDTFTRQLKGIEALVRIKNKDKGIISPFHFISLAEELGLIGYIDEWVFTESCRQYSIWRDKGYKPVRISVNLSAVQLRNKNIVDRYMAVIRKYNVNQEHLQLEITENALIENEEVALEIIESFKEHNISIALDDFGTGHSSLRCINLFPIDTVKIDRIFIQDSINSAKNIAIIKGVMHMADSLGINIIAEGVEKINQYDMIKSLGCNEIQGYFFSKPCSNDEVEKYFDRD